MRALLDDSVVTKPKHSIVELQEPFRTGGLVTSTLILASEADYADFRYEVLNRSAVVKILSPILKFFK